MKKQNDGQVKTSKPYAMSPGKKFILALVAFGSAIGSMFGFAGCVPENTPTPTPTPDPEPNPPIVIVENIKFSDFITDHADVASNFVKDFIRPNVAQGKEVRAESWAIKADVADESIKEFEIVYVYDIDETQRGIESATVTLDNAVSLNDIVENKINAEEIKVNVKTTPISTFDAKENNSNIDMSSFTDETVVYSKDYVKETFEAEKPIDPNPPVNPNPPVVEDKIESIQDLIGKYSNVVYDALNDNFLESAGKSAFGSRTFKAENLVSVTWDIGTSDTISEIKFIATYANSDTDYTYGVSSIKLNDTINVKDLNKDNIVSTINNSTATTVRDYTFRFDPSIQDERAELTNAICDKVFETNGTVINRYIVDNGYKVDNTLNESREYKVVEITENGIEEISIRIKDASDDNGYISNLENTSNYRTFDKNSYKLSGNKVDANENVNANMIDLFENEDDMTI